MENDPGIPAGWLTAKECDGASPRPELDLRVGEPVDPTVIKVTSRFDCGIVETRTVCEAESKLQVFLILRVGLSMGCAGFS